MTIQSTDDMELPTALAPRSMSAPPLKPLSVSVVVAWVNPLDLLIPVLEGFARQRRPADQLIVVTRHPAPLQAALRAQFPDVVLLTAPCATPITRLRALGLRRAQGDIVAITEDHCVPASDWVERIAAEMQSDTCLTMGGPVENACTDRWRDWAAFLTEYVPSVRAAHGGAAAQTIPGNNAAYKRQLLDGLAATLDGNRWESFFLAEAAAAGIVARVDPDCIVLHRRPFDVFYFVRQRFYFARSFAGMRNPSATHLKRIMYAAGCVILPPLLWARHLRTLIQKQRLIRHYLFCTPLILFYFIVGACGESIGYLFGAGNSLEHVE